MTVPHGICGGLFLLMIVQTVHLQALPKNSNSGIIPGVGSRCCRRPHDSKALSGTTPTIVRVHGAETDERKISAICFGISLK